MNSANSVPVPSQLINVTWSSPSTVVIVHNLTAGDVYTWTAYYLSGGLPSAEHSSDVDQPLHMRKLLLLVSGSFYRPILSAMSIANSHTIEFNTYIQSFIDAPLLQFYIINELKVTTLSE
jgi:hypothetical protein